MKVFMKESAIPVLLFLGLLASSLVVLGKSAETGSRRPRVIDIVPDDLMSGDALGEQTSHAMGHHPGLAAARSGQNQQRPLDVHHGLSLGIGQAFQEVIQRRFLWGLSADAAKA